MGYNYKRRMQMNKVHLFRELNKPERMRAEQQFTQDHEDWSDEKLLQWVVDTKRQLGKRMKPDNTVGYIYLQERLGSWSKLMGYVNSVLEEERRIARRETQTEDREATPPTDDSVEGEADSRAVMDECCAFIRDHLDEKLSEAGLAEQYGYTHSHFSRMFLRTMGMPATDYIRDQRLALAADCLRQGYSLGTVARRSGYHSVSHLHKAFTKHYGITPEEYCCTLSKTN